jgi:hypothetical protein
MLDSNLQERFDSARTHVPEKEQVIIHATVKGRRRRRRRRSSSSSELNLQILERAQ